MLPPSRALRVRALAAAKLARAMRKSQLAFASADKPKQPFARKGQAEATRGADDQSGLRRRH